MSGSASRSTGSARAGTKMSLNEPTAMLARAARPSAPRVPLDADMTMSERAMPLHTEDEILTVEELAAILKLRPKTIYNHISAGRLTRDDGVIHLNGRCVRIVWRVFEQRMLEGKISLAGAA